MKCLLAQNIQALQLEGQLLVFMGFRVGGLNFSVMRAPT